MEDEEDEDEEGMEDEDEEDAGKEDEEGMDKMGAFRKWLEVGNELRLLSMLWSEGWEEGSFLLLGWRCRIKSALAMAGRARFFGQGAECSGVYS